MLKHEIITAIAGLIGISLIVVSSIPFTRVSFKGIFQGIGTGLIAGVVLLFASAARGKEEYELSRRATELNNLWRSVDIAERIGGDFYHNVARVSKNSLQDDYSDLIEGYIQKFEEAHELIKRFDMRVIENDEIKPTVDEFRVMIENSAVLIHKQETCSMKKESLCDYRDLFSEITCWIDKREYSDKFRSRIDELLYKANKELARVIGSPV